MDLKTSILYENGTAALIQLDYHMDVTSLKKEQNRKRNLSRKMEEAKYTINGHINETEYGYHQIENEEDTPYVVFMALYKTYFLRKLNDY